ncbi:hypothetical protein [Flavihumibacter profundi]|jgi:hypothetical protein|uniref:hypothetical protein n=1 Tax=Flavihumibacter profundi TaxID=2716883 RepID=UPI001CC702FB|nr:hypothetical protein [Flavihumibacter profundi]MBZ5857488.1 hypothetical protein [Flavihumibacter profundi]
MDSELLHALSEQMGISLIGESSFNTLRQRLAERINQLINLDFQELVRILYRVDVNENKLKFLLKEKVGEDAAYIIADLLIERQLQKIKTRRQFQQPPPENEEDRW